MSRADIRLAVVGGGPRAAYALECLARQAGTGGSVPARIDVYEPRPVLGTGSAYEGGQPDWVRLNIPQQMIDAGAVRNPVDAGTTSRSPYVDDLTTWAGDDEHPAEDLYPPRSRAGEYLAQVVSTSIRALAPTVVTHRRQEVSSVRRTDVGFAVTSADGATAYDAVLLVTGHARAWRGRLPAVSGDVVCLPALPVGLLTAHVAAQRSARVRIRGASLTAIDAVLALTEGTGGSFGQSGTPGYRPGDPDVRVTLVSRTGRLMDVKPESGVLRRYGVAEAIRPALAAFEDHGDAAELLVAAATLVLQAVSRVWAPAPLCAYARQVEHALGALEHPAVPDARERLAQSLAQACGLAAPDATWALGQAWRSAYPWLVRRQQQLSVLPLAAPLDWPGYLRLRPELERLAFGPPPVNARKLIALMDAGRLDVVASSGSLDDLGEVGALADGADLVVDAVSAPPGVRDTDDPLWVQLLADGLVAVAPYGRGIRVDQAAGCLRADGTLVPGLSAVGRMTEDVVLGNDTLSRTMHADLERWAQRLCTAQELVA